MSGIDNDLLVLQSAVMLSLTANKDLSVIRKARREWSECSERFYGSEVESVIVRTGHIVNAMIDAAGLRLPTDLRSSSWQRPGQLLAECAAIIDSEELGHAPAHICMALLNMYQWGMTSSPELHGSFLRNDTIGRAWQAIEAITERLAETQNRYLGPTMSPPIDHKWNAHDTELLGDYSWWARGTGFLFQTLNGWDSSWALPQWCSEIDGPVEDRAGYWAPLPHLALGPLGWSDPALGIARWIVSGMPTGTPELSLLRRQWGTRALAYFCHPQMDWLPYGRSEGPYIDARTTGRLATRLYEQSHWSDMFAGCGGLHMVHHLADQLLGNSSSLGKKSLFFAQGDIDNQRVLVLEKFQGWYRQLADAGSDLPEDTEVLLIAPPVGLLGKYRRSRQTGRWYSGSHEAHRLGHETPVRVGQSSPAPTRNESGRMRIKTKSYEALAWNLATEICRRHNEFRVLSDDGLSPVKSFNLQHRKTGIVEMVFEHPELTSNGAIRPAKNPEGQHVTYQNAVGSEYERTIRVVEDKLGLTPSRSKPTSRRILAYRAIGAVLGQKVYSKQHWYVQSSVHAATGNLEDRRPRKLVQTTWAHDLPQQWENGTDGGAFWVLFRDGKPLALVTEAGIAWTVDDQEPVDLMTIFTKAGRSLTATVGAAFGTILK
ncbi:hypothetical protein LVY72_02910 [Arthrobacter sp. I2-34]|uniref:T3SS peptide-binding chaperone domain-containing protein n=1 Tax=Arthrobacter hankyongi TaxID=2904801 RepID=A0ABS9L2H4_9MICC|nr:hypothetical protein [Arthrobacter hankyongi]MCG2620861.1 hypothetical protein [Arthrobacter hankyongi]